MLPRLRTGMGLLRARLNTLESDVYASARIDIVKRLRMPGTRRLGPSLRATEHNRKGVARAFPQREDHSFPASGAVNEILQKNGWIAAACSTSCIEREDLAAHEDRPARDH
ncbi:hypothetical protein AURDEDRAFT_111195, partial [Auricularia subglabra TFB-10046 SS5]